MNKHVLALPWPAMYSEPRRLPDLEKISPGELLNLADNFTNFLSDLWDLWLHRRVIDQKEFEDREVMARCGQDNVQKEIVCRYRRSIWRAKYSAKRQREKKRELRRAA